MKVTVTALVTYEIYDVETFDDAVDVYQQCVKAEARHLDGVQYIGTKEMFLTEMTDDGEFMSHPTIVEIDEVE